MDRLRENEVEHFDMDGVTVRIMSDFEPTNPRTEWDNVGTMVCFHRRYQLGDKHEFSIEEAKDEANRIEKQGGIVLPLYLYDHSGITIRTSPFSCPWDSGQVGVIWITAENIRSEYSVKRISKKIRQRATSMLESEVKAYDDYLTGNCYGYITEDPEGNQLDSCWGFLGDIEYCREEATSIAKYNAKDLKEKDRKFKEEHYA